VNERGRVRVNVEISQGGNGKVVLTELMNLGKGQNGKRINAVSERGPEKSTDRGGCSEFLRERKKCTREGDLKPSTT